MSKFGGVIVVLLSLGAGFGGGWAYQAYAGSSGSSAPTTKTETSTETVDAATLADCLKKVWGEEKYAALSVNADLASAADNLAAIQCYES